MVWRSRCAEVVERLWGLMEEQPTRFPPQQRERLAVLHAELAQLAPELAPELRADEDGEGDRDDAVGDDGLTASERRAWRVEQLAEAALLCVGLEVDEDPNAGRGDGMWLSSYFALLPEQRASALAAIVALGQLFEGFVLVAAQPDHLRIGAMEVYTFGETAPPRFAPGAIDASDWRTFGC
jgi:hypothetical protein